MSMETKKGIKKSTKTKKAATTVLTKTTKAMPSTKF